MVGNLVLADRKRRRAVLALEVASGIAPIAVGAMVVYVNQLLGGPLWAGFGFGFVSMLILAHHSDR